MIEEGRRKRPIIPREERICKTCNKIEDGTHFLIDCDKYKDDRMDKFKIITNEVPCFEDMPDSETKLIYLMSQENKKLTNLIAQCIHDWFKIRESNE